MRDPLGKNLLLPLRFAENFQEESSASLQRIFSCIGFTGAKSSTSLLGIV